MHIPPLVAVRAPTKFVPPQYPLHGNFRLEHIFMISLTSGVLPGKMTNAGVWEGGEGDQTVEE